MSKKTPPLSYAEGTDQYVYLRMDEVRVRTLHRDTRTGKVTGCKPATFTKHWAKAKPLRRMVPEGAEPMPLAKAS